MRKNCAIKALPFFWRRNEKAEAQDVWSRGGGVGGSTRVDPTPLNGSPPPNRIPHATTGSIF